MQRIELEEMANYYINNDISIKELARMHGVPKTEVVRLFKGEKDIVLPADLQEQVNAKKEKKWIDGKSTCGRKGHITMSKDQLIAVANKLVDGDYTLDEIAASLGRSKTTLYDLLNEENIGKELYTKVNNLYQNHKETRFYGKSK